MARKLVIWWQDKYWWWVVCASVAVFINTLSNEFVWDDVDFVVDWSQVENYGIGDLVSGSMAGFKTGTYRPIRTVVYILGYFIWGLVPVGYHAQAMLIHAMIAGLCYLTTKKITGNREMSLIGSLLFAVHPIHVEAVAWITSSFDLVGVVFMMLSWYWYLLAVGGEKKWYRRSVVMAGLAFFSYEITVMLPVLIIGYHLVIDRWSIKRLWKDKERLVPFGVGAMLYGTVRMYFIPEPNRMPRIFVSLGQQVWFTLGLLGEYVYTWMWPIKLSINHQLAGGVPGLLYIDGYTSLESFNVGLNDGRVWLGMGVIGMTILVWLWRRHLPGLVVLGIIWMLVCLLPMMQIFTMPIVFSENDAYPATIGLAWISGWVGYKLINLVGSNSYKSRGVMVVVTALVIMMLGLGTISRNKVWASNWSLWSATLSYNPNSPSAKHGTAVELIKMGKYDEAIPLLEEAVKQIPDRLSYKRHLVEAYEAKGDWDKAMNLYEHITLKYPNAVNIWMRLGVIYETQAKPEKAIEAYEKVDKLQPNNRQVKIKIEQIKGKIEGKL